MMAFCPEHPKWDQNPKFTPPKREDERPHPFHMQSQPPGVFNMHWGRNALDAAEEFIDREKSLLGMIILYITKRATDKTLVILLLPVSNVNAFIFKYLT